ncbi:hypothetical protein BDV32DRAFT_74796 [Aspergillus pseudonomiae]|uniref:Uncharacterized protein n=1 Tax=Aspergillus pseudonomiae TaxID=1506151 RepID=A0A5N6IFU6_9EURO|nr:uncharacterized protein BDV37DRAFT_168417 [Aspergillus pseudonomiae]KAB8264679.1 hypothetical protein BDV32DRAFT_74796 [Aspergillus pseudonomiae]KAE8401832.1 hypothetical protein BDV37DRAFT_168417 [Aspergillus pseudonomiae]
MDDLVYELDPKGDIFLILDNVSTDFPYNLRDITTVAGWPDGLRNPPAPTSDRNKTIKQEDDGSSGDAVDSAKTPKSPPQRRLQIRASSKHLTLACPQFQRTLQNGFQEGTELRATGCLRFPVRDWEAVPFLVLMLIIHHRTRLVPWQVSLDRLVEIAQLVDYYECHEAVEPFSNSWLIHLKIRSLSPPYYTPSSDDEARKWISVSWVFNEAKAFQESSKYLESKSTSMISFSGLPVPGTIQDEINRSRRALMTKVVECMHSLSSQLRDGPERCSELCDCALLGVLTKGMHRAGILSLNSFSSFEGISFTQLAHECRNIKTPSNMRHICRNPLSPCSISKQVEPLLQNIEKLNVGLKKLQFVKDPFLLNWNTRLIKSTVKLPS